MTRAGSMAELLDLMGGVFTPESIDAGTHMDVHETDVFLSPFAKCGTTRLQMIVHTLRTGGDLDFDDISRVVPWLDIAQMLGQSLSEAHRGEPRAFKSHRSWDEIPKGGRYIVSVRDPGDAFLSAYRFMEGWTFDPGCITLDEFVETFGLATRNYWKHLASWWAVRDDDDVLLLSFAGMNEQPRRAVEKIAHFIGLDASDELVELTVERSSLAFMKANEHLFDDYMNRQLFAEKAGLALDSDASKVHTGLIGGRVELSQRTRDEIDTIWSEEMSERFGVESFGELDSLVRERSGV